jgi:hypothetical protein
MKPNAGADPTRARPDERVGGRRRERQSRAVWTTVAGKIAGLPPLDARHVTAARPAMPLFWKAYTSDVTQFIEDLKRQRPSLEAEQRAGRALLWDKRVDRDAQAEAAAARVPQQPYVYQTRHD